MSTVHTITSAPAGAQVLREYQREAIEAMRALLRDNCRRVLLVAPTGAGKTTIAGEMIRAALARSKRVIFLAHRKELIDQCSARLEGLGVAHGVIKADDPRRRAWLSVHVASVQTLVNREAPAPDLVFVDECHRARAKSYEGILARWPAAAVVGLTATPIRTDGRGLGDLFDGMVQCPDIGELTAMGYLVPTRVFAPAHVDLSKVRVTSQDFSEAQLAAMMDRPSLTGDIVAHWLRLAAARPSVAFAVNCAHSVHIRDQFRAAGVAAEHLDGKTRPRLRDQLLADLAGGAIRVLCSVGVITEGWDCPPVSCAILARPTVSLGLYLQMVGRILRPFPNKFDGLVLDHAGCVATHGLPDDPRLWELTVDAGASGPPRKTKPKVCPECYQVWGASTRACRCGWVFSVEVDPLRMEVVDGELTEVGEARKLERYLTIPDAKREMLFRTWAARGVTYATARYRAMFHEWPRPQWSGETGARHGHF